MMRALSSPPFKNYRAWWSLSDSKYAGTALLVKKCCLPGKVFFNLDKKSKWWNNFLMLYDIKVILIFNLLFIWKNLKQWHALSRCWWSCVVIISCVIFLSFVACVSHTLFLFCMKRNQLICFSVVFSFKAWNRWPGHFSWIWDFLAFKYLCPKQWLERRGKFISKEKEMGQKTCRIFSAVLG